MAQRFNAPSRAQLIGGVFATGALAACGGAVSNTPINPSSTAVAPACTAVSTSAADRFGINEIFSNAVFNSLDKTGLLATFDPSPNIEANHQGYLAQTGRQAQSTNVITHIPAQGIVIQSPGTYTFGQNILWTPNNVTSAAITIQSSNVTLNLSGFSLTAAVSDTSRQFTGVLVAGPAENVTITNGTIAGITEYGILARYVCGLNISQMTVTGVCMQNLAVRFLTPAGIQVSWSNNIALANCSVTQLAVTTDSCAGIQMIGSLQATVNDCSVNGLVNNDGAVQGISYLGCINVATTGCTAQSLQSHFNGNILTTGHTVLGFCPIFCQTLSYVNCTATGLTGCCDDCHGMSVFLDSGVTVSGFQANNVVDGVSPSNTGAKATGLEVYGSGVAIMDCSVTNIHAINPQDKQSAGFSTWGTLISFVRCTANNVSVEDDIGGSRGIGYGWAPDPRPMFRTTGAFLVSYTNCAANQCDVAFDTWFHVDSTWTSPTIASCPTGFLAEPGGTRTVSGNACSECQPPIVVTLTNIASGNTYPGS